MSMIQIMTSRKATLTTICSAHEHDLNECL